MTAWIFLTGEYPPTIGGVATYTRKLAVALAGEGDHVDVFAPSASGSLDKDPGVATHLLPDRFGPRSLLLLERALAQRPNARLVVQYVPDAFGMRAMNVPFCLWLTARRRPFEVVFHEVAYPVVLGRPWPHRARARVTGQMASLLVRRASRAFVSTPAWNETLQTLAPGTPTPICLPSFSNVDEAVDPAVAARVRADLGFSRGDLVIGTFGMFSAVVTDLLKEALPALLARDAKRASVLIGQGSVEFAKQTFGERGRVTALGTLSSKDVASHLAACDVIFQPYVTGINFRRASASASLALGLPILTNVGQATEAVWKESGAVALADTDTVEAILEAAEPFFADGALRADVAARGQTLYRETFSIEQVVRKLRREAER